ncbi:hypothetical protein [Streptomyces javensis]|uniref:Uncharacterized protein n=1 Tax=Streptomyces javensis TaxID=114698 RepID=A0ABP4HQ76_9ACTN
METTCAGAAVRTCDRIEAADGEIRAFVPEPGRRERLAGAARRRMSGGGMWTGGRRCSGSWWA